VRNGTFVSKSIHFLDLEKIDCFHWGVFVFPESCRSSTGNLLPDLILLLGSYILSLNAFNAQLSASLLDPLWPTQTVCHQCLYHSIHCS